MIKIAHIINPVKVGPKSDLFHAQPITFETMRLAKEAVAGKAEVELLSTQYPEDHEIIPDYFTKTPDLDRSVMDVGEFKERKKYPLIADILQRMYDHSDAEYLIFTNVDIAVQPGFYESVLQFIEEGHDAFIINRRRIPDNYTSIEQLPEMWKQEGKSHPGFDCFIFHRSLFSKFELGNICVGIPFIGIILSQNVFCFSENFKLYDQEYLTFHIGMEVFKHRASEYLEHNHTEFKQAIEKLYLQLDSHKFPYADQILPHRLITWGLHPSIPIRLCLRLEWRRLFG